jgi:hypothetical protein
MASDSSGTTGPEGNALADVMRPGSAVLSGRSVLRELIESEQVNCGAPAVWRADGVAASFIVKAWAKRVDNDVAVQTVWNLEVRNLLRLDGLPKAHNHFASLEALGADNLGYYVVVDGGGRHLLSEALTNRDGHHWLRRVDQVPVRARLWDGLRRLAVGLDMLHDQGTLHRALRTGCVFTDVRGECDFRLSGFEWSLRLSAAAMGQNVGTDLDRIHAPELDEATPSYSVASDWFDFGLLAAEIIGGFRITGRGLEGLNTLRRSIITSRNLTEPERELISGLLLPNPDERRLKCIDVPRRITGLAMRLLADQRSLDRPLLLALHLTAGSELADAIFRLSQSQIRIDDGAGQMNFIQHDLSDGPSLTIRSGTSPHYALHGRQISYRVYKFEGGGGPTWRAGFCAALDRGSRDRGRVESLQGRHIRVGNIAQMNAALRDPNTRAASWDQVAPFESALSNEPGSDAYEFLKFTNTVDALLTAARIWPVEVVAHGRSDRGRAEWVSVQASQDDARDRMAIALGLEVPATQMERAFFEEIGEVDGETRFHLVDEPRLGDGGAGEATWVIRKAFVTRSGTRRYTFERVGGTSAVPMGESFLRPADLSGSYVLLERRLKAIESLRDQTAMLRAVETPGSASRDTMEELVENAEIALLDCPKRRALRAIGRSQPLYALQGPPGTGKTTLLEAMVRRALGLDSSLQFVVTAQANSTVDTLGVKLKGAGVEASGADGAVVVRLDEDDERQTELSPSRLVVGMAKDLVNSTMGQAAPEHIARRLAALESGWGQEGARERSDMGRLLMRGANVVLATSTSGDLASLLDEGKRFDWCIVEEAGKAHGFDLALPMLASHRMLMIGDHEQLPAFNERAYLRLLEDPQKVRQAIGYGAGFIPRKLGFDLGPMESDEAMQAFEARCARWHPMVRTFGHVFKESIALPPGQSAIAGRLDEQHRMHPEICDLLRACFYPNLRTADVARERLARADPFVVTEGSWLPTHRIVFVDMPYVQSVPGAKGQDVDRHGRMVLSSAVEAAAVVQILSQLKPQGECELQILAPYNRQVSVLRRFLATAEADGVLPNLSDFHKPRGREQFGATIDGFQGEEADIVVVSLVRNNHAPMNGGVGFLSERPRLNVMLSRARRKLVLVGSWEFFLRRATDDARKDPAHLLHHLAIMFHELGEAVRHGTACIVPHTVAPAR